MPIRRSSVKVNDVNQSSVRKLCQRMDGSHTKIGFPTGKNPASGDEKTMADVATIASFLEFGIHTKSGDKAWPFMSQSYHENKKNIARMMEQEANLILSGESTVKQSLGLVGEFMVNETKAKIRSMRSPALEPETIKKKGSSNPLIDKGQMLNSVTHIEVVK